MKGKQSCMFFKGFGENFPLLSMYEDGSKSLCKTFIHFYLFNVFMVKVYSVVTILKVFPLYFSQQIKYSNL